MINFFQKLGFGLKKTSENLSRGITDIFTKESLSDDVVTDLEDVLYTADVGVQATTEIIEKFSAKKFDKKSDINQIKQELCQDIVSIIKPSEQEFVIDKTKKPFVILMVGVNGAGKTTTFYMIVGLIKPFAGKVFLDDNEITEADYKDLYDKVF